MATINEAPEAIEEEPAVDLPTGPLAEQVSQPLAVEAGETPEARHAREIQEAERECSDAYLELIRLKDAAKDQSDYLKACGERLKKLHDRGPEELPLFDHRPAAQQFAERKGIEQEPADDKPSWWSEPTSNLFDEPLAGFGKKLVATICEKCPTIGELEELRGGAGLESIKGVSKAKAEELTERILDYCGTFDRGVNALVEPDFREEWEKARDACDETLALLSDLPEAGESFAYHSGENVSEIRRWIVDNQHATEAQLEAIANIRDGAEKWQR